MNVAAFLETPAGRGVLLLARIAFWIGAAVLAYALCRRGLTLGDEGDLLSGAAAILEGKIPYRDIDMFVTPGAWYLNAAIFAVAGPSVIATRIAAAGCLLATMAVSRRIVRRTGGPLWGDLAAALVAIFAVWAWPAWTWSFYSPWATLLSMSALACTLEWLHTRRRVWLFACGVMLGLAIAFKQNYGVFSAAGCALAVLLDELVMSAKHVPWRDPMSRTMRAWLPIAAGGAAVLIPAVVWLAAHGALAAAAELLLLRPFQGFVDSHTIRYLRFGDLWRQVQVWTAGGMVYMGVPVTATNVPVRWMPSALSLVVMLHVLLYWIPVFGVVGLGARSVLRLRRRATSAERALLAIVTFAAVYFLGVFPRADFNHLINVYQPVLVMLAAGAALLFGQGRWRTDILRRVSAGAAAALLACFVVVAAVWMNDLRKTVWIPLEAPRAGVLVEGFDALLINDEIELMRTLTANEEPLFALPQLSMIPFLAERPMPSRYHNFYAVHIGHDGGADAVREMERSDIQVVLTSYDNFFSDPEGLLTYGPVLVDYLQRYFRPLFTVGNHTHLVLTRRREPLEEKPTRELWTMCDIRGGGFPATFVREHLLFRSLYHSFRGAWAQTNQGFTTCQLQVPAQARMRLALDVRQPAAAVSPVMARAEIWLLPTRGAPVQLVEHEWPPLATEIVTIHKAGQEFDVDLSPWSGQVVTLLLRSVIEGEVPQHPFDYSGLTVMWNGARLESPDYEEDEQGEPEDASDPENAELSDAHAH